MTIKCSFCNKGQDAVERMIASPAELATRVYICDDCIRVCGSILKDDGMDLMLPSRPSFRMRLARKIAGLPAKVEIISRDSN